MHTSSTACSLGLRNLAMGNILNDNLKKQKQNHTPMVANVAVLTPQRLYKEGYEKNKAKIHITPDMVDIVSAKSTQKKVSEIDYRIRLHEWTNIPDLHANALARKVNDQLSDVSF